MGNSPTLPILIKKNNQGFGSKFARIGITQSAFFQPVTLKL